MSHVPKDKNEPTKPETPLSGSGIFPSGKFDAVLAARTFLRSVNSFSGELKEAYGHLVRSRGFRAILRNGRKLVGPLTREVETFAKYHGLSGKNKKALAVEAIVEAIPEPPWLTWLLRFLLGRAVDAAVKEWNRRYGKPWPAVKS